MGTSLPAHLRDDVQDGPVPVAAKLGVVPLRAVVQALVQPAGARAAVLQQQQPAARLADRSHLLAGRPGARNDSVRRGSAPAAPAHAAVW